MTRGLSSHTILFASETVSVLSSILLGAATLELVLAAAHHWRAQSSFLGWLSNDPHSYRATACLEMALAAVFAGRALLAWGSRKAPGRLTTASAVFVLGIGLTLLGVRASRRVAQRDVLRRDEREEAVRLLDRRLSGAIRVVAAAEENQRLAGGAYIRLQDMQLAPEETDSTIHVEFIPLGRGGWRVSAADRETGRICVLFRDAIEHVAKPWGELAAEPQCGARIGEPVIEQEAQTFENAHDHFTHGGFTLPRQGAPHFSRADAWTQYRGGPERLGTLASATGAYAWETDFGNPVRATIAAAGDLLFVGAHGTGVLAAYDRRTGTQLWHTRVPNWIHQDPVEADDVLVVGFGDKWGRAGSGRGGVSAHDALTGRRLWIAYSRGAVMTSPVISKGLVMYGTLAGELVARDLATGKLRWSRQIHQVTMAPPAVRGTTLVVAQDERYACAYRTVDGSTRWCHDFPPGSYCVGHAAPTIAGSTAYFTLIPDSSGWQLLLHRDWHGRSEWLQEVLSDKKRVHYGVQSIAALDLNTGRTRWETALGGGVLPIGHTAGTAVVQDGITVVASPPAQAIYALRDRDGTPLWMVPLHANVRGPVVIANHRVIAADAAGRVHVLALNDGHALCERSLRDPPDRTGPTIVGGSAIFAGVNGHLVSISVDALTTCEHRSL